MPDLKDEVPGNWKTTNCDAFNILFCNYPIFLPTCQVTDRIKVGDHYGELVVSHSTKDDGGNSQKKMAEWWDRTSLKSNSH